MQIFIKLPYSKTITIDCDETTTIKQLKYLIYKKTKREKFTTFSSHQKLRYGIQYLQNFNKFLISSSGLFTKFSYLASYIESLNLTFQKLIILKYRL